MMNENDLDRALKIAQLIDLCARMGGSKAFEPIQRMANEALHEFKVEMGDADALAEEERRAQADEDYVPEVAEDNPPPKAREADGIDNDNDGLVDESDETTTEVEHDPASIVERRL